MNQNDPSDREIAYARIQDLIQAGCIAPERPLSERQLAEQLGLGRTPVREAMQCLAREGLLDVVPMRGTYLRQPSIDDVRDIYEVRLAIEGMATALVAQRRVPAALRRFRTLLTAATDRDDDAAIARMHRTGWDFHDAIVAATGNQRMRKIYEALRMPIMALRSSRPVDAAQARRSLVEHISILDAIEAGDAVLAQRRMTDHLAGVLEARVRLSSLGVLSVATINGRAATTRPGRTTRGTPKEERLK